MTSCDANNRFITGWSLPLAMTMSLGFGILALAVTVLPWLVVSGSANIQAYPTPVPNHLNATCSGACNSNSTSSVGFTLAGQSNPEAFGLVLAGLVLTCLGLSYLAWRRGLRDREE